MPTRYALDLTTRKRNRTRRRRPDAGRVITDPRCPARYYLRGPYYAGGPPNACGRPRRHPGAHGPGPYSHDIDRRPLITAPHDYIRLAVTPSLCGHCRAGFADARHAGER